MFIAEIPNRNSPPAFLLRESYREDGKVKSRTLANLSSLPKQKIELLNRVLRGETLLPGDQAFRVISSRPHGHVQAVLQAMRLLNIDSLLASRPCRERDLVLAMIAQRVLQPSSKLAACRQWIDSTLAEELNVADADVDELYLALDWLRERQTRIENKLAKRHLAEDAHVLYDVSSSSYFGHTCPLARHGYNRDGRRDLPCIVYGVLTDSQGRPVAMDVYPGNTGDPATVPDQVQKLRKRFDLSRVVLVGDRGMLTQSQIDVLREQPGLGWLSALRSEAIRALVEEGKVERSLFDKRNLAEIVSPEFPGERLVACFNPLLAERRRRKREELLSATEEKLGRLTAEVKRRTKKPLGKAAIGVKAGKVIHQHKVGKHFELSIEDGSFAWRRKQESIDEEAALDGIYVIRTSESATNLSQDDAVRGYKRLADVEQAFRTLKGLELLVRPIHHRVDQRVRGHFFVCLLAYYVMWHMKRAWSPLTFADEDLTEHRAQRDPVAQAKPTEDVKRKRANRKTDDGHIVHSFRTLLNALATQSRQLCTFGDGDSAIEILKTTEPTPLQREAFRLLEEGCRQ